MRCNTCTPVNDVHEIGCNNRLGSELYRTETAGERMELEELLARLLRQAGLWQDWEVGHVESREEGIWDYVRQGIRDGRDMSGLVRVQLHRELDGGDEWPVLARVTADQT